MANGRPGDEKPCGDRPANAAIRAVESLGTGFRTYERVYVSLDDAGGATMQFDRDVLRSGEVVGVLLFDPDRQEVVLIRQFRLAAHLATGRGDLVELVAGRVDPGETSQAAAIRECREESGLDALEIVPILTFMPAPAFADEVMSLWLARVDAREVPDVAGHAPENEVTRPLRLPIDASLRLLGGNAIVNAPLIIALQWLAANRTRLSQMFAAGGESA